MIKMIITGHIGQDARVTPVNGKTVINFPVAVNRRFPNADGELVEKTVWYNCAKWETREGNLFKYLKKGTQVLVEGEPDSKLYRTKENKPGIDNTIRVTMVELLGSKKENGTENKEEGNWNWDDDKAETVGSSAKTEDEEFWAAEAAAAKASEAQANTVVETKKSSIEILEGMEDAFADQVSTGLSNK